MVMKKAELYLETSARPWNSSVVLGMAVATIVKSRDTRKIASTRAMTMQTNRAPVGYSFGNASSGFGSACLSLRSSAVLWLDSFSLRTSGAVDGAFVEPGPLCASRRPGVDACSGSSPLTRLFFEVMISTFSVVRF